VSLLITFEGVEGCGKSLQAGKLYERLTEIGLPTKLIHEPGGVKLGEELALILKESNILPLTELFLFNASRSQLVYEVISPMLEKGYIVICDRFADSTVAYQGYGRGLDLNLVKTVTEAASQGVKPALTILLDLPVEIGLSRKEQDQLDRFEREGAEFMQKVREGYLKLAREDPERWLVIDATLSKEEIARRIWQKVAALL
jgi:dTMP kinase